MACNGIYHTINGESIRSPSKANLESKWADMEARIRPGNTGFFVPDILASVAVIFHFYGVGIKFMSFFMSF